MTTLGDELPKEMARVRELLPLYDAIPTGIFAASLMRNDLDLAAKALAEGDGEPDDLTAAETMRQDCIKICLEEAEEWDSDRLQNYKNYAGQCANRIAALPLPGEKDVQTREPGFNTWVLIRDPNCVPEQKGPFKPEQVTKFLREVFDARPHSFVEVLTLHDGNRISIQDGPECLEMADGRSSSTARKHRERTKVVTPLTPDASAGAGDGEPVAWVRDVGGCGDDECLMICNRVDAGAFPVYKLTHPAPAEGLRKRIEVLEAALGPFAFYYRLNDCEKLADDDALEVAIADLRRAAAALSHPSTGEPG